MIKRRSFLTYFSIGWLASCFPVVLAACAPTKSSNTNTTTAPSISGNKDTANPAINDRNTVKADTKTAEGFTVIGSVADLDKAGYLQTTTVAVARDPANSKQLLAVNPKCTHQGCDVKWVVGEKRYECPCHDSDFAADGKVLKGPASTSLATYPAKIVGTQVLVKI
ncbi:ubiquinol-cytochrome c reductase iron-sulfur subunit [Chamaesiphon sp.]|uniref:QcrA and Rieske domain-containing protein n=1 Tax=Chamaesiphon sp. TaxID=2814140 RepID=UPI003593ED57